MTYEPSLDPLGSHYGGGGVHRRLIPVMSEASPKENTAHCSDLFMNPLLQLGFPRYTCVNTGK